MEWLRITEQLPSNKNPVYFTFCDDGEIHKDIWYDYYEKDWMKEGPMGSYGSYRGKVTHWMPFPKPPKENIMKWANDEYKEIKHLILDIIVKGLNEDHARNVTFKIAHESIDRLFDSLLCKADP